MSDEPLKSCVKCGKEVRRLIFGGTGVIFKGSGFYVTDKSKSSKTGTPSAQKGVDSSQKTPSPCSQCPAAAESGKCSAGEQVKAATDVKSA